MYKSSNPLSHASGTLYFYLLLLVMGSSNILCAQYKSLSFDVGVAVIQGETSGSEILSDDFGIGVGMSYQVKMFGLWEFFVNASYHRFQLDWALSQSGASNMPYYESKTSQSTAGVGLLVNLYNPNKPGIVYRRVTPYLALVGGVNMLSNEIVAAHNFSSSDIEFFEGRDFQPYGELIFGLKIKINAKWSINAFGGARSGFTDNYDGVIGTGGSPDIFGRVGVGVSLALR